MIIRITKDQVEIKLSILEKIFSFHGDFKIPRENIVSIRQGRPPLFIFWELRLPGSFFPGLVKYGTYYVKGRGKEFWLWTRGKKHTHTIELENHSYKRIVIGVNEKLTLRS